MKKYFKYVLLITILLIGFSRSSYFTYDNAKVSTQSMNIVSQKNNYVQRNINDDISEKYYKESIKVQIIKYGLSIFIPLIFLLTGFSAKIRNFSMSLSKNSILIIGIYGVFYNLIDTAINSPIIFYSGFIQTHKFGLSHMSLDLWMKNFIIGIVLTTIEIFLFLWIPYYFIKKSPKHWWIYTGMAAIPVIMTLYLAKPVVIDPIFNDYKQLDNKKVELAVYDLTQKAGIKDCNVLQVDKSKETNRLNAYMTGIGKTKRIVLWDTTIKKLNINELKFVTAHEIGHYVLGHIKKSMLLEIAIIFIMLYIIKVLAPYLILKFKNVFGFSDISDVASLPLLILIINIFFLIVTPASNAYSCYIEHEADTFALELTQNNTGAVTAFEKLAEETIVIDNPNIVYRIYNYDHPPLKDRVEFFQKYKPWEEGKRLRFEKYIDKDK